MSDQMQVFEENQLDDMLLRSIETLLDEKEQMSIGHFFPSALLAPPSPSPSLASSASSSSSVSSSSSSTGGLSHSMMSSIGRGLDQHQAPPSPIQSPPPPMAGQTFTVGSQTYRKWSNNESMEPQSPTAESMSRSHRPTIKGIKLQYFQSRTMCILFKLPVLIRDFITEKNMPPSFSNSTFRRFFFLRFSLNHTKDVHRKPFKKYTPPSTPTRQTPPASPLPTNNPQLSHYQAILSGMANQILHQYMQLNFEFLSAQATMLGLPLEQYVRNLLIATANPPILMPMQVPQATSNGNAAFVPPNPMATKMQNGAAVAAAVAAATGATTNRPMHRMPFNKRQN